MCTTTNATTVLYGTAGTEDCLLERVLFENRRLEERDGIQRNFIYPWTDVVEYNADYRTAVQAEALRLGTEHPHFLSEYALQTPPSAGRLFSDTSLAQMANSHALPARPALVLAGAGALDDDGLSSGKSTGGLGARPQLQSSSSPSFPLTSRTSKPILVAGIDIAGEEEATEGAVARALHPHRDSTAVAIAQVTWHSLLGVDLPHLEILHFYWWTGRKHTELLPELKDLLTNVWPCTSISVDKTGIGATTASFLREAIGTDIVHPFSFTAVSKSLLGYQFLAAVSSGRLKVPTRASEALAGPDPPPPIAIGRRVVRSLREESEFYFTPLPPQPAAPPPPSLREDIEAIDEFWKQAPLARSHVRANQQMSWGVEPRDGHDDLLVAVALAVEAAQHSKPRVAYGRRVARGPAWL